MQVLINDRFYVDIKKIISISVEYDTLVFFAPEHIGEVKFNSPGAAKTALRNIYEEQDQGSDCIIINVTGKVASSSNYMDQ